MVLGGGVRWIPPLWLVLSFLDIDIEYIGRSDRGGRERYRGTYQAMELVKDRDYFG